MCVQKIPLRMRAAGFFLLVILLYGCDVAGQAGVSGQPTAEQQAIQDDKVYAAAYAAYERKDDATALAGFSATAARKPDAKFMLGIMVGEGRGTAADGVRSFRLLSEAAAAGSHSAAMIIGLMQVTGNGTEMNPEAGVALLRTALRNPALHDIIRKNVEFVCQKTRTQLKSLPSLFDMVQRHMPGKATFCAVAVIANEDAESGHYAQCVRDLCQAEEGLGEDNSCDAMEAESQRVEKQRGLLKRTVVALGCPP